MPPWQPGPAKASAFERQLAMQGMAWAPSRMPAFALRGAPQLQQDTAGLLPPGSLPWAGATARGTNWQLAQGVHGEHLQQQQQQQQQHGALWPGPYQPSGERMPAKSWARCQASFCTSSSEAGAAWDGQWFCWILSAQAFSP